MRFGSVCSGIEAASVAWHPLGWEAAWLSEIEPFPSAVLKHHHPDVPNLGDMTTLPDRIRAGEVEAPDLFCGGTPCQAFSVAGLRKSLDDARGNLSLTFCEIANAIDDIRLSRGELPAVIFWENVPGVLSTKDNAFGCFLAGLAGDDEPVVHPQGKWKNSGVVVGPERLAVWRVLDAQYFGVAQRRRRVFVLSVSLRHPRAWAIAESLLPLSEGVRGDTAPSRQARQSVAGTIEASLGRSRGAGTPAGAVTPAWWNGDQVTPALTRTLHNQNGRGGHGGADNIGAVVQPVAAARMVAFGEYIDDGTASAMKARDFKDATDLIAFSAKDYGGDAMSELSPTLRAGGHATSHANAGVMPAIAFNARQDPDSWHDRTGPLDTDGGTQAVAQPMAFNISPGSGEKKDAIHITQADCSKTLDAFASNPACHQGGTAVMQPINIYGGNKRQDRPEGGFYVRMNEDTSKTLDAATGLNPTCSQGGTAVLQAVATDLYNGAIDGEVTHSIRVGNGNAMGGVPSVLAPTLTASNDPSRSPQSSEVTAQVAAVVEATNSIGWSEELTASVELAGTLQRGGDGGRHDGVMTQTMQVRRLTPVECERLQGFPDNYTAIPWRGKPADQCPDGPRYKALGNSWAVPVVRWIGSRVDAAVNDLPTAFVTPSAPPQPAGA